MNSSKEDISRLISYWLRHHPEEAGLMQDEFGWVGTSQLLSALGEKKISLTLDNLHRLNNSFDKVRWEINSEKIRATHGHSFLVLLGEEMKTPPATLYHGTSIKQLSKIIEQGILPMNRQFVHLSENEITAFNVGKRHGKPFIIEIETENLVKNGWEFYQTSDNVWLTKAIPSSYLSFLPWHPVTYSPNEECYGLQELKNEIGLRFFHPLYKVLKNLRLAWKSQTCDDNLFANNTNGKYYMVHLTWRQKQEVKGWPHFETYSSFEEWIEKGLWADNQYFYNLKE
jgi:putative RNA 2'-phosphotransferase